MKTGSYPFIMQADGYGAIFGPGMKDGPFPEHYEPLECPVEKNLMSAQFVNPVAAIFNTDKDVIKTCDPRFPFVGTTYRVTEHWQTGVLTRWLPWLLEAEPQIFVEMSEELAKLKIHPERGNGHCGIGARSGGGGGHRDQTVQTLQWSWARRSTRWDCPGTTAGCGRRTAVTAANLLTPAVGDPNTRIPETKAFMVNVRKKKEA